MFYLACLQRGQDSVDWMSFCLPRIANAIYPRAGASLAKGKPEQ
ncbi:hypothetical protein RSal33209_2104 [Renibacterium salmoninarum ATCC 33209]|uniref:Uncharacterized protein n=1 Tax=Renibacterium salmoninarum (strain ATCC 33209 / DSM 20767 / JCM 11484 / NBRC 15589 / NCIMB 2235) TaxID=288705 RepID=A9WSP8_RENSM|nr:hypothetical protein RSal33209_2104 [Renibacterium salmoninarum ATCC 33209]